VPSIILTPVAVTKATAKQTVGQMIADGFLKASQICTGAVAPVCAQNGLT
jgi:D-xylose transport system substrate-binding protein